MEHQSTRTARPLWALPCTVSHSPTPQSTAGASFHHRPLRVRLSPVPTGAFLFKTSTPGDYLCTNSNSTGNQRCAGIFLDVQLWKRRLRTSSWGTAQLSRFSDGDRPSVTKTCGTQMALAQQTSPWAPFHCHLANLIAWSCSHCPSILNRFP